MTTDDRPSYPARALTPTSFLAAATALSTIDEALRTARTSHDGDHPEPAPTSTEQALATLLLRREAREQPAGWEPGLMEAPREAGANWAALAHPLGVSSRQAAE